MVLVLAMGIYLELRKGELGAKVAVEKALNEQAEKNRAEIEQLQTANAAAVKKLEDEQRTTLKTATDAINQIDSAIDDKVVSSDFRDLPDDQRKNLEHFTDRICRIVHEVNDSLAMQLNLNCKRVPQ